MRLFISSDIHGSFYWCSRMIDCFNSVQADRILLLGDVLYHGPRNDLPDDYNPKKVIKLLNGYKNSVFAVRGNCDTEVDQMVLDFPILADYGIVTLEKQLLYVTHGHVFNKDKLPPLSSGDILIHGHTHVPENVLLDNNIRILNPGSVSIPKENSFHSSMVYEDGKFTWINIENGKEYMNFCLEG